MRSSVRLICPIFQPTNRPSSDCSPKPNIPGAGHQVSVFMLMEHGQQLARNSPTTTTKTDTHCIFDCHPVSPSRAARWQRASKGFLLSLFSPAGRHDNRWSMDLIRTSLGLAFKSLNRLPAREPPGIWRAEWGGTEIGRRICSPCWRGLKLDPLNRFSGLVVASLRPLGHLGRYLSARPFVARYHLISPTAYLGGSCVQQVVCRGRCCCFWRRKRTQCPATGRLRPELGVGVGQVSLI